MSEACEITLVQTLSYLLRSQKSHVQEELTQLQERLATVQLRLREGAPDLPSSGVLQSAAAFEAAIGHYNGLQVALRLAQEGVSLEKQP